MRKIFFIFSLLLLLSDLKAQLRLPAIFNDHMVVQQQSTVPIWGWGYSTQDVTINVSWDTTTIKTKTNNAAYWSTNISTPIAGGPHSIRIKAGDEEVLLKDVMAGESMDLLWSVKHGMEHV